jgi:serine/threonine protein kinase
MADALPLHPDDPLSLGGYQLVGRLGTGGQGVVFLGRGAAPGTAVEVAIKLLHSQLIEDAAARLRFVRELAVVQRVAGFCTAQVLDADVAGDRPYIVTEYVPGPSLQELVRQEGPRTGADLDRLAIGTVTALTAIHQAGIVHRDFKPPNVLMGPDGPRVIDFGIARALDTITSMTSQLIGTPAYMAPEQLMENEAGPPSDMFAWAVTMLFAATGHSPFEGGPLTAVAFRILQTTPDLSALPALLAEVAGACLAKDPALRPQAEQVLLRLLGTGKAPSPDTRPDVGTPSAPTPTKLLPESPAGLTPPRTDQPPAPSPIPAQWQPPMPPPGPPPLPFSPTPQFTPAAAATRRFPREASRPGGPAFYAGLAVATLTALFDMVALGVLVSARNTPGGPAFLLTGVAFGLLGIVTVVAVVIASRGSRRATWTVIGVRTARAVLWVVWSQSLSARLDAHLVNLVPQVVVAALLGWSLWKTR